MIAAEHKGWDSASHPGTASAVAERAIERRLAAIMFADVVGSSRLIAADDVGALGEFKAIHANVVGPQVTAHNGRIIQFYGDGFFVEFANVSDAVTCAVAVQRIMADRYEHVAEDRRVRFRIGIHFGDVLADGDGLLGTGVNIAARIESLAPHGGVLISKRVYEEIRDRSQLAFRFAGVHRLKNIPGPVTVFEIRVHDTPDGGVPEPTPLAAPAHVPLIALLPFQSHGEGADWTLILNAIGEEMAYQLSRFSDISVIASESTRRYSGAIPDIASIRLDLDVDYVVSGSVMRHRDRVRLFIRLFETADGSLVWSDRYERDAGDVFTLQDEVARDLASRLPLRIERAGLSRLRKKPTYSLDAYECFLRGRELYRMKSQDADLRSIEFLEKAIEIDPDFADPYAILGAVRGIRWAYSSWGIDPRPDIMAGRKLILRALALNSELPRAHSHLAWTYLSERDFDRAMEHLNIGISLNPNDVDVLLLKAYAICYMGEPEESIRICHELMRLNPHHPQWYLDVLATAQFVAGRYDESLTIFEKVPELFPENLGWMAACLAYLGRPKEARQKADAFVERIRSIWKGPADAKSADYVHWWLHVASSFRFDKDRNALENGIRLAGLPD